MIAPGFRWDQSSRAVLGDALVRLGPTHCVVEVRPDEIVVAEQLSGGRRDRGGAARLLDCGAAVSTAWTVLRVLGREPVVTFPADPDRPDVVAVVRAGAARTPASAEWARYVSLRKLDEPPASPPLRPVSLAVLGALAADDFWPDTTVRLVRPEWAPTLKQLGADLTGQSPLLITTPGDSRRHHVLAGAALHTTRLAAAVRGFASRPVPLPLLAPGERARHAEESLLPGIPQALLLVGFATRKRGKS
ncbi:hypothetical protein QRX60_41270 [Amycolatopsis mongoliensis]|uniref:Uncharacterized protein n=1 Tax=Amycolatopsis mongoliensis TaxID=715475 RepID=A0A9Y2JN45_9PSEU|nr:hypothetical protein [Amycolatopsis sp. 4-36]WIY00427.1 hypothetical protein QRX60_41270 [Amycolatopsis sp. 4-36]